VVDIEGYQGISRRDQGNIEVAIKYQGRDEYQGCDRSLIDRNTRNEDYLMGDDKDIMNKGKAR
jgi:hypothetical protein